MALSPLRPFMQASTARRAFCRFAFSYLQEFLGRPAPVLVRLQAAAEKVAQESRVVPGVLQFWGPVPFYQFKNLHKMEEDALPAPFLAHNSSLHADAHF